VGEVIGASGHKDAFWVKIPA